jgi:hypothetical protein
MILIDQQLVFAARKIITGANVHHIGTLLFQYEQAVSLHNRQHPGFRTYPSQYEEKLRQVLRSEKTVVAVFR